MSGKITFRGFELASGRLALTGCLVLILGLPANADSNSSLHVSGSGFVIERSGRKPLKSQDLVGAVFQARMADGAKFQVRIDAVNLDPKAPHILLHSLSFRSPQTGQWAPLCEPDISGRAAGFPLAGEMDKFGHFVRDPKRWFLTCTSGAEGKCLLFGYDPWSRGPAGSPLAPYYEACVRAVRADFSGKGISFTRKGTLIGISDTAGVLKDDTRDTGYPFEAGWSPQGAVCVAHTRWPDLLPLAVLLKSSPGLVAHPCDKTEARRRGAILFTRSALHQQ